MDRTARLKLVGWWLLVGLIAAGANSLRWPSVHFDGEYLPFGMDAFYHARRILDTVADPATFYEFDRKIHAPEGSLLTWPWGYDYTMAWLVRGAQAVGIPGTPIQILVWLPVAAVFASVALVMLIGRRLGLSQPLIVIAGLAVALSPLTQYLHGVGQLDHHFAEYIFVLATIACGLRWLRRPDDNRAAIVLGAVLGTAPAVHNGMFVLQVPVLTALLVLWLQDVRMPMRTARLFAASLFATTILILVPSLPFRLGLFEFYTLSWFHLYVACGTAGAAIALAGFARNPRNLALLSGAGVALLIPLARQALLARGFLAGTTTRLETIVEMHPPWEMVLSLGGNQTLAMAYSPLAWLTPAAAAYCAWKGWQERAQPRVFFWICSLMGLMLFFMQLRMHYFGSFVMYLPWLVLAQACMERWEQRRKLVMLSTALIFALVYWVPARYQLGAIAPPAGDPGFRALRPILQDLREACEQEPGIVLADNDAGHYIRYYTQCSVIANNFLLTRQHAQKIKQIDYLTSVPATAFPGIAPHVRYILVRPVNITRKSEDKAEYMSYSQIPAQLITDLLLRPVSDVPSNYVLIQQASMREPGKAEILPFIRLFKVNPTAPQMGDPASLAAASQKHVVR